MYSSYMEKKLNNNDWKKIYEEKKIKKYPQLLTIFCL